MAFTVLYDANVLYPAPLRDLLVQLALTDLFRARWTDRIHDEWTRNVLENRPDLDAQKLHRVRDLMNQAVPDCLATGFEGLIPSLELPDPDDRHVFAAAIIAGAQVIVTFNLSDFPARVLAPYNLEAQHPDEFVSHLMDLGLDSVLGAMKTVRTRLWNPPRTAEEYLERLEQQGLVGSVAQLRGFIDLL